MIRWTRLFVCVFSVLVIAYAVPATAARSKLPVFEDVGSSGGSAGHLPIGGGITKHQVIDHAYSMPSVQTAIQEMLARGYVPHRDYDDAGISQNPPLTVVTLQFDKPGLMAPHNNIGAPMIMIGTTLDENGMPSTQVSGGLVFVDTVTAAIFTADSLPQYQWTDASFDIVDYAGGSVGSPLKRPTFGGEFLGMSNSPGDKKFRKWIYCFAVGSLMKIYTTIITTPPIPQLTIGRIVVEHVILAATCAVGVLAGGG